MHTHSHSHIHSYSHMNTHAHGRDGIYFLQQVAGGVNKMNAYSSVNLHVYLKKHDFKWKISYTLIVYRVRYDNVCNIFNFSTFDNYICFYKNYLTTFMVFEILCFMVLNMYFVIEKNVGINFDSQYFA